MLRIKKHILLAIFTMSLAAAFFHEKGLAQNDLSYLKSWNERLPIAIPKGNPLGLPEQKANLWDDPAVSATLEKTLGLEKFNKLKSGWNSSVNAKPVTVFDNILAFSVCEAHNCYNHTASIFINLDTGKSQSCWREETTKKSKSTLQDYWIGLAERPIQMPEGFCSTIPLSRLYALGRLSGSNSR